MDRAYLALTQARLKALEKAQYAQAEAAALGVTKYGTGSVEQARRNLAAALQAWADTLVEDPRPRQIKEAA